MRNKRLIVRLHGMPVLPKQDQPNNQPKSARPENEGTRNRNRQPSHHHQPDRNNRPRARSRDIQLAEVPGCDPVGLSNWVKLEVIGDQQTLFPDTAELLRATEQLVKEGFVVLPYTNDDLIVARRLVDAGAAAVMPLGAPIGSGMGIQNHASLRILRERITEVPLIIDAGVGTASDAAVAMELGADGVLMNTAIAEAQDAVLMASAMRHAVEAGRQAYPCRTHPPKLYRSRVAAPERSPR